MKNEYTVCIVGVGNPLRSDDNIGAYVCSCMDNLNLPGVETLLVQQLQVEMIARISNYELVIIVDASVGEKDIEIFPVDNIAVTTTSSHHVSAGVLQQLSVSLYKRRLPLYMCAVKGENFELGEEISAGTINRAEKALHVIVDLIKANMPAETA